MRLNAALLNIEKTVTGHSFSLPDCLVVFESHENIIANNNIFLVALVLYFRLMIRCTRL